MNSSLYGFFLVPAVAFLWLIAMYIRHRVLLGKIPDSTSQAHMDKLVKERQEEMRINMLQKAIVYVDVGLGKLRDEHHALEARVAKLEEK